ncbi:MAG: hypothetical protein HFE90_05340 [Firmicutes bacterium]|nr:hypothetical protein [Bacillota bacterium]
MKKSMIAAAVLIIMVISLTALCSADDGLSNFKKTRDYTPGQFADINSGAWYEEDAASVYELGLMSGTQDNIFSPNGNMTVAETVTLAARLRSIYNNDNEKFEQSSPWYQTYVDYAVKNRIIGENEFADYKAAATRTETATILAASLPESALGSVNSIAAGDIYDVSDSEYYSASVYKLYNAGIITGNDDYGSFKPRSNINRKEMAVIINRIVYPSKRVSFTPKAMSAEERRIKSIISNMSINEKIYQLFIVTPERLTGGSTSIAAGEEIRSSLERYPVGGIIYFAVNLKNPAQTKAMLANTQKYAEQIEGLPIFLCVDEEGGRVARIGKNAAFNVPKVKAMQNIGSKEEARAAGSAIGSYLFELGFNFDFAPVADVITVNGNTDIGNRSFGSNPQRVAEFASAVSDGLHSQHIMSTFKHFPGNGATAANTHKGFAYTNKTLAELYQTELIPFMAAEENGVDAVMVAHISVPNVTGDNTPSSLSYYMITEVLRKQIGYSGLIITDSLGMGAVSNIYNSSQAAVMAFKAGNDMLLMPQDFHSAVKGISDAVERGEITERRIDESLYRIIKAKLAIKDQ